MRYKKYDEYIGKDVWGYAFEPSSNYNTFTLNKKPVLGIIKDDKFYEYNNKGKIKKSSEVGANSRYYALTEDEAKEGYNMLINSEINILRNIIKNYQEMKL